MKQEERKRKKFFQKLAVNYKNILKRGFLCTMSCILLLQNIGIVKAHEKNSLEENIHIVTKLLEEVLEEQYHEKEQEIKDIILEKNYDYTLTMENFYQRKNPFSTIDYLDLIATYISVKDYLITYGYPIKEGIAGVQFLEMQIEEKTIEEKKAVLIPNYIEHENGLYQRDGIRKIEEETTVPVYENVEDNFYQIIGEEIITPEREKISYGEVVLNSLGTKAIFDYYQIDTEVVKEEIIKRKSKLTQQVINETLIQSVFVQTPKVKEVLSEDMIKKIEELTRNLTGTEALLVNTALSLVGRVPYQWGGKPKKAGYDTSWWLYNEEGEQKGLDCSGFVQWVYWTAGFNEETVEQVKSSWNLMEIEDTPFEELRPGDIGILNHNETTNHLGIYLGEDLFIHCASGKKTVTVSAFPFTYFKTVQSPDKLAVDKGKKVTYSESIYTESVIESLYNINKKQISIDIEADRYLLAQLMIHEAGNQGYNGKAAVGEVILNRLCSEKFKQSTIRDIIYAAGQFSHVEKIENIVPDQETLIIAEMVLRGNLRIFNNPDVLFYRNSMITDNIPVQEPINWGKKEWYTYVNNHAFYLG